MSHMRSNLEWQKWGEKDPLWAVATRDGKNKDGPAPWTADEFYRFGEADWACFRAKWREYGLHSGVGLEIGCGAGRLTRPMATDFEELRAVDVSPGMLRFAKTHVSATNVEFVLTNGRELPFPDRSVNAVFSAHVFQHFNSLDDATQVLREVHRVMVPGATLMIHLPLYQWPGTGGRMYALWHRCKSVLSDAQASHARLLIRLGLWRPLMRMLWYPTIWVLRQMAALGFDNAEIRVFAAKSNQMFHSFILATKI